MLLLVSSRLVVSTNAYASTAVICCCCCCLLGVAGAAGKYMTLSIDCTVVLPSILMTAVALLSMLLLLLHNNRKQRRRAKNKRSTLPSGDKIEAYAPLVASGCCCCCCNGLAGIVAVAVAEVVVAAFENTALNILLYELMLPADGTLTLLLLLPTIGADLRLSVAIAAAVCFEGVVISAMWLLWRFGDDGCMAICGDTTSAAAVAADFTCLLSCCYCCQ